MDPQPSTSGVPAAPDSSPKRKREESSDVFVPPAKRKRTSSMEDLFFLSDFDETTRKIVSYISCLMTNPNEEELLSEETKKIWDKVAIFKQRYKKYSNKVKSLEEALAVVNLELSLTKNENSRLKAELKTKQDSITKYQIILKELVEVEDRYCKLLQEKKNTDKELATEKKLRLDLEIRQEEEKKEIQHALQEELRILKEDAAMKEEATIVEYSQTIEQQNKEIDRLKQEHSDSVKKHEEQLLNTRQDLKNAQKKVSDLRRDASCSPSNKVPIPRDMHLNLTNNSESNLLIGNQEGKTAPAPNKCLSVSKRASQAMPDSTPASRFYPLNLCSPRHWPPSSRSLLTGSMRSTERDSQQPSSEKKGMQPLEVFRLPTRSCKKSPIRKKRKLYSRSDDTL